MGFPPKISSPPTEKAGMGAEDERNISILFSNFHLFTAAPLVCRKGRKGIEEGKHYSARLFCFSDAKLCSARHIENPTKISQVTKNFTPFQGLCLLYVLKATACLWKN